VERPALRRSLREAVRVNASVTSRSALESFLARVRFYGAMNARKKPRSIARVRLPPPTPPLPPSSRRVGALIAGVFASLWGALCVVASSSSFAHGRPLRVRRRPMLAKLVDGDAWLDDGAPVIAPQSAADAWRANGKVEHASVAAFARLADDLTELGAPAKLVQAAHDDALDEIVHTRLCFSLARAIDGHAMEPAPLEPTPHTPHLATVAIDSLVDGALGEGTSARVAAKLAGGVVDERIRVVLVAIAADEGKHARHAWETLAWCLDVGGPVVHGAIHGALRALPETGAALAGDATLERYGIAAPATQDAVFREVRATVVERARAMLIAASGRPLRH
jgi:hypothetical protein